MARMYSRKKGKAGSKKPAVMVKQSWLGYKQKEVEILITKIAKTGKSASLIGLELRDIYGIPDVPLLIGKRISQFLQEKKLSGEIPDDLKALMKRTILIRKHLGTNKHDQTAKRGLTLTESKMNRLIKYYKGKNRLPVDWKYDPEKVRLMVE